RGSRRGIRSPGPHRLARRPFPPLPRPEAVRPDRSPMITPATLHRTVSAALEEDAPWGDITSIALLPADALATADLSAGEAAGCSGGEVFAASFTLTDPAVQVDLHVADGARFDAGDALASVWGPARSLLTAERVALNFAQRMSGIATLAAAY